MTAAELAAKLDGRQYRSEITRAECEEARAAGLVVAFGASDDLLEFRGAINDEISAYEGTTAYVTREGLYAPECEDNNCPHERAIRNAIVGRVTADWCAPGSEASWTIRANFHGVPFKVMEDEELYCVGLVFALADVEGGAS